MVFMHVSFRILYKPLKQLLVKRCLSQNKWSNLIAKRRMDASAIARPNPVVMKIDTPEFRSIFTKELEDLIALFRKYGHEIRIAGGAVRDILMGKCPKDIDIATTATPTEMKEIFTEENIRMINMNGEKHGTITPRINDKTNFEITTLRVDAVTDGRHAEVIHTKDWLLDANRRDLTINSMFLGFDGSVYDYFYGYDDLKKKRIAFVGDPDQRIKEDYLRILRYFRFYGRIADDENNHDKETLRIVTKNAQGLTRISGERIWQEWKHIITGNFGCDLTIRMMKCELAPHMGLPEKPNIDEFVRVFNNVISVQSERLQPITVISALLYNPEDAITLNLRLKFTVYERELSYFLTQNRKEFESVNEILPFQQLSLQTLGNANLKKEYVLELLRYHGKHELYNQLMEWQIPLFPIKGNLLIEYGAPKGQKLGVVMNKLKLVWSSNQFNMSRDDLLNHLPKILEELNLEMEEKRK
ncbi:CCA tRNA nucleotidyltransferase 1, mitochondrial [Toxorhynchites rutilus septentrionalis]|uniref:CCA tRNA nucleotidyltransferase 1, mitochondrial n=1 Tax=Toxorhynchites rutilus septentrionalis TaxID=329112 RepID=UPI00247AB215|nr:CCA tRNA nucleotidyltransferase 1, mitochondrial [Toxorhynchites rutilus septentrionalis]